MNDLFYRAWFLIHIHSKSMICMVPVIHIHGLFSRHERIKNLDAPFYIHVQLAKKHSMFKQFQTMHSGMEIQV